MRGDGASTLTKRTAEAAFCRLTPGPRASGWQTFCDYRRFVTEGRVIQ
jgi:hypothetical protein